MSSRPGKRQPNNNFSANARAFVPSSSGSSSSQPQIQVGGKASIQPSHEKGFPKKQQPQQRLQQEQKEKPARVQMMHPAQLHKPVSAQNPQAKAPRMPWNNPPHSQKAVSAQNPPAKAQQKPWNNPAQLHETVPARIPQAEAPQVLKEVSPRLTKVESPRASKKKLPKVPENEIPHGPGAVAMPVVENKPLQQPKVIKSLVVTFASRKGNAESLDKTFYMSEMLFFKKHVRFSLTRKLKAEWNTYEDVLLLDNLSRGEKKIAVLAISFDRGDGKKMLPPLLRLSDQLGALETLVVQCSDSSVSYTFIYNMRQCRDPLLMLHNVIDRDPLLERKYDGIIAFVDYCFHNPLDADLVKFWIQFDDLEYLVSERMLETYASNPKFLCSFRKDRFSKIVSPNDIGEINSEDAPVVSLDKYSRLCKFSSRYAIVIKCQAPCTSLVSLDWVPLPMNRQLSPCPLNYMPNLRHLTMNGFDFNDDIYPLELGNLKKLKRLTLCDMNENVIVNFGDQQFALDMLHLKRFNGKILGINHVHVDELYIMYYVTDSVIVELSPRSNKAVFYRNSKTPFYRKSQLIFQSLLNVEFIETLEDGTRMPLCYGSFSDLSPTFKVRTLKLKNTNVTFSLRDFPNLCSFTATNCDVSFNHVEMNIKNPTDFDQLKTFVIDDGCIIVPKEHQNNRCYLKASNLTTLRLRNVKHLGKMRINQDSCPKLKIFDYYLYQPSHDCIDIPENDSPLFPELREFIYVLEEANAKLGRKKKIIIKKIIDANRYFSLSNIYSIYIHGAVELFKPRNISMNCVLVNVSSDLFPWMQIPKFPEKDEFEFKLAECKAILIEAERKLSLHKSVLCKMFPRSQYLKVDDALIRSYEDTIPAQQEWKIPLDEEKN